MTSNHWFCIFAHKALLGGRGYFKDFMTSINLVASKIWAYILKLYCLGTWTLKLPETELCDICSPNLMLLVSETHRAVYKFQTPGEHGSGSQWTAQGTQNCKRKARWSVWEPYREPCCSTFVHVSMETPLLEMCSSSEPSSWMWMDDNLELWSVPVLLLKHSCYKKVRCKSEPDGETIGCMIPLVFLLFLTKSSVWIHRLVPVPSVSAATTKSSKGTNNLSIFGSFDHLSCK